MSDCDTFRTVSGEFGDDNAVEIRVKELLRWLLSPEAMSAEVAFPKADDVFVVGVVSI